MHCHTCKYMVYSLLQVIPKRRKLIAVSDNDSEEEYNDPSEEKKDDESELEDSEEVIAKTLFYTFALGR